MHLTRFFLAVLSSALATSASLAKQAVWLTIVTSKHITLTAITPTHTSMARSLDKPLIFTMPGHTTSDHAPVPVVVVLQPTSSLSTSTISTSTTATTTTTILTPPTRMAPPSTPTIAGTRRRTSSPEPSPTPGSSATLSITRNMATVTTIVTSTITNSKPKPTVAAPSQPPQAPERGPREPTEDSILASLDGSPACHVKCFISEAHHYGEDMYTLSVHDWCVTKWKTMGKWYSMRVMKCIKQSCPHKKHDTTERTLRVKWMNDRCSAFHV